MILTKSDFYCVLCGRKGIPILRKKGQERENGHLKKLFCIYCNKSTNHAECKIASKYEYDDFKIEFEYGNFDENGNRIKSYGELRSLIHNGQIRKIKTLDSSRDTWIG